MVALKSSEIGFILSPQSKDKERLLFCVMGLCGPGCSSLPRSCQLISFGPPWPHTSPYLCLFLSVLCPHLSFLWVSLCVVASPGDNAPLPWTHVFTLELELLLLGLRAMWDCPHMWTWCPC